MLRIGSVRGRSLRRAGLVAAIVGIAGVLAAFSPVGASFEEDLGLRWLFLTRGAVAPPSDVVVVSIDEKALDRVELPTDETALQRCLDAARRDIARGWPRCLYTRLVEVLDQRGASVIVFDVAFNAPRSTVEDAELAAAVARAGRVVLVQQVSLERMLGGNVLKENLADLLPIIAEAAIGAGPFPLPKVPARVNQFWAFKTGAGDVPTLPAVALQVCALSVLDGFRARLAEAGVGPLAGLPADVGEISSAAELRAVMRALRNRITADPKGYQRLVRMLQSESSDKEQDEGERTLLLALARLYGGGQSYHINFYGPPGTIRTIPGDELLRPGSGPDLDGKIVFVGVSDLSDADQEDAFYTVFTRADGVALSGVEIAATAFANLLHGETLARLGSMGTVALLLAFGAVAGGLSSLIPGTRAVAVLLGIGLLYFGAAQMLFAERDLWLPVFVPLAVQIPLALLLGLILQYLVAKRERENAHRAVRYYVPEKIADSLAQGAAPATGSELVFGTCLSTDAEHYTTVSERIGPQALADLMNSYFSLLSDPVVRRGGAISDIFADSMMCIWSAPQPERSPRLNACLAALDIQEAVLRFNEAHPDHSLPTRIGLHAGWVAMGNLGGGGHYGYGLIGDIANTTSRIQGLNKHLGTRVLASDTVVADLDGLLLRRLGAFRLEGKSRPLTIFEIVTREEAATDSNRDLCRRFAAALEIAEASGRRPERWLDAAEAFAAIRNAYPNDGPSWFYQERCRRNTAGTPVDDAAVIQMEAK